MTTRSVKAAEAAVVRAAMRYQWYITGNCRCNDCRLMRAVNRLAALRAKKARAP
jgi:hypothetical protein